MSPLLKAFYRDYLAWLEAGAPNAKPYFRSGGLCRTLHIFSHRQGLKLEARRALVREFNFQLLDANLPCDYPFDNNQEEYEHHLLANTQHENPARIAWVKEHAK